MNIPEYCVSAEIRFSELPPSHKTGSENSDSEKTEKQFFFETQHKRSMFFTQLYIQCQHIC